MNIPIARPYFDNEAEITAEIVKSKWIAGGPKIKEFEDLICSYTKAKYAVAVSSATTALDLLLKCAGVKENDEVIVPSFSFIATANCILYQKAVPVFADIDLDTFNTSAEHIEKVITEKTKFILLVHQFGRSCNMNAILSLAQKHNITVMEDSACSLGTWYNNTHTGLFEKGGVFSFHPRKIITTGEGGMLVTNDKNVYEKAMMLRNHGMTIDAVSRDDSDSIIFEEYPELGYNYRLTDIQAAIGMSQMNKLAFFITERKRIAQIYNNAFSKLNDIIIPENNTETQNTYQSYAVLLKNKLENKRNHIMQFLRSRGIASRRSATAIHIQKLYEEICSHCPNSEYADKNSISLPIWPGLTDNEIQHVIDSFSEAITR